MLYNKHHIRPWQRQDLEHKYPGLYSFHIWPSTPQCWLFCSNLPLTSHLILSVNFIPVQFRTIEMMAEVVKWTPNETKQYQTKILLVISIIIKWCYILLACSPFLFLLSTQLGLKDNTWQIFTGWLIFFLHHNIGFVFIKTGARSQWLPNTWII